MIKAVIFDCFGVIITDGFKAVLDELDQTHPGAREYIKPLLEKVMKGQLPVEQYRQLVADYLGISMDEYSKMIGRGEIKDQRLMDYIKNLRPKYKTAMLSNVGRGGIERRFSQEELGIFDELILSGEVGFVKPEPQIYKIAVDQLGIGFQEAVFIDDSPSHVEAAIKQGMHAIVYEDREQGIAELEQILAANSNN